MSGTFWIAATVGLFVWLLWPHGGTGDDRPFTCRPHSDITCTYNGEYVPDYGNGLSGVSNW